MPVILSAPSRGMGELLPFERENDIFVIPPYEVRIGVDYLEVLWKQEPRDPCDPIGCDDRNIQPFKVSFTFDCYECNSNEDAGLRVTVQAWKLQSKLWLLSSQWASWQSPTDYMLRNSAPCDLPPEPCKPDFGPGAMSLTDVRSWFYQWTFVAGTVIGNLEDLFFWDNWDGCDPNDPCSEPGGGWFAIVKLEDDMVGNPLFLTSSPCVNGTRIVPPVEDIANEFLDFITDEILSRLGSLVIGFAYTFGPLVGSAVKLIIEELGLDIDIDIVYCPEPPCPPDEPDDDYDIGPAFSDLPNPLLQPDGVTFLSARDQFDSYDDVQLYLCTDGAGCAIDPDGVFDSKSDCEYYSCVDPNDVWNCDVCYTFDLVMNWSWIRISGPPITFNRTTRVSATGPVKGFAPWVITPTGTAGWRTEPTPGGYTLSASGCGTWGYVNSPEYSYYNSANGMGYGITLTYKSPLSSVEAPARMFVNLGGASSGFSNATLNSLQVVPVGTAPECLPDCGCEDESTEPCFWRLKFKMEAEYPLGELLPDWIPVPKNRVGSVIDLDICDPDVGPPTLGWLPDGTLPNLGNMSEVYDRVKENFGEMTSQEIEDKVREISANPELFPEFVNSLASKPAKLYYLEFPNGETVSPLPFNFSAQYYYDIELISAERLPRNKR